MQKIRENLSKLPAWIFTILTIILILWLTLAPDPLGDDAPELFPGADKIVHALMFGFLTVMIALDHQRKYSWQPVSTGFVISGAILSALLGIAVEFAQFHMALGRGFEIADMISDCIGCAVSASGWILLQHLWSVGKK